MKESDPEEGPYRRLVRGYRCRILMGVLSLLIVALLGALFESKGFGLVAVLAAFPVGLGFYIAAMLYARCPYCGWTLDMRFDPLSFRTILPWIEKTCSACKRDLTAPFEETLQRKR